MNAAVTVFFLIIKVFSLYFLAVSLFGLCSRRDRSLLPDSGGLRS